MNGIFNYSWNRERRVFGRKRRSGRATWTPPWGVQYGRQRHIGCRNPCCNLNILANCWREIYPPFPLDWFISIQQQRKNRRKKKKKKALKDLNRSFTHRYSSVYEVDWANDDDYLNEPRLFNQFMRFKQLSSKSNKVKLI